MCFFFKQGRKTIGHLAHQEDPLFLLPIALNIYPNLYVYLPKYTFHFEILILIQLESLNASFKVLYLSI